MRIAQTGDQWWKNAVVYCLDVETYLDSDGDGVGDFAGLLRQIDYLAGLGVTCLWLMPFQPTPNRDDGYDVADYYAVDERLGTLGDFVELVRTATDRGIRVIVDLVLNHTSDEHPWFAGGAREPRRPRRDWYVWRDEPSDEPKGLFFPDKETSNWAYDDEAGQYYLHRFYSFQPDLDTANPAVRDEIARIMGFWLRARRRGLPAGRCPGAARDRRAARAGASRTRRSGCAACARSPAVAAATRCCSARSTSASRTLRATSASTATSCTCSRRS